jgi:hypothetical protein
MAVREEQRVRRVKSRQGDRWGRLDGDRRCPVTIDYGRYRGPPSTLAIQCSETRDLLFAPLTVVYGTPAGGMNTDH